MQRLRTLAIGVVLVVLAAAVLWWLADTDGVSNSTGTTVPSASTAPAETTPTTVDGAATLVAPPAGATIAGTAPCPDTDGSSQRATVFEKAPPECLTAGASYQAVFDTTKGKFTATLDSAAAPVGVNNFVFLARYHFYDGIPFHRIAPDFAIQAGDPIGEPWGSHGPGYTIAEEPPKDLKYQKYDLAMANTSQPSSTGSQFFVATGDTAALDATPTYTKLGAVVSGTEVVDAINAVPTVGPSGDTPTESVVINSITIVES